MSYFGWEKFNDSRLLLAGRYDAEGRKLQLRFVTGSGYEYYDVPESFWWGLCQAQSKGEFFNKHILNSFTVAQLDLSAALTDAFSPNSSQGRAGVDDEVELDKTGFPEPVNVLSIRSHSPSAKDEAHFSPDVAEDDAHQLIEQGDFLGAVSIYEELEEDVRLNGWGTGSSEEMVCYFLYNQVVCLAWAGEFVWAGRRAGKLARYAEAACFSIVSYEFTHGAVDCWVSRTIKDYLDGRAAEPQLNLAMGALQIVHSGVSKPE